jgi:hypothetical protein
MWGIGRLVVAQASKNVPNKVCKIHIVLLFDRLVSTDYRKLRTRFTAEPLRAPALVFVCISNNGDNSLENDKRLLHSAKIYGGLFDQPTEL